MARPRAIPKAVDLISGEVLTAAEVFATAKEAADIRKRYNENKVKPACLECEQLLIISKSGRGRHFFQHFAKSGRCLLKEPALTEKDALQISSILAAKESDRHKYLKRRIADVLSRTQEVDIGSIYADNKFVFDGAEKRRPDVYCKYAGRELVFEIQLSDLSLRYILDRCNFYRQKGIYLIWILDQFDVKGQSTMEKDIKYLSSHQNFFKLDNGEETLHLRCDYKLPKARKGTVFTPWESCSLPLSRLQFDPVTMQAYFFDFKGALKGAETEAKRQLVDLEREREARPSYESDADDDYWHFEEQQIEKSIKESVENVIQRIAYCKERGLPLTSVEEITKDFHQYEWDALNERLGFLSKRPKGKSLISYYISCAKKTEWAFIYYLLKESRIEIDVSAAVDGTTALQEILGNSVLVAKPTLILRLFERGYELREVDEDAIRDWQIHTGDTLELPLYKILNRLSDRSIVPLVKRHTSLIYVLESARLRVITGLRFANWISLANHAITAYRPHWSYIEKAFRHYEVWPTILSEDKRRTFETKLIHYRDELPEQDAAFEKVFKALYPEI